MDVKLLDFKQKLSLGAQAIPPCVVFYGEDAGQVRQMARQVAEMIVPGLQDPFRVDRLSFDRLCQEPNLLVEAAGTLTFGEGKRLVLVDDGTLEGDQQRRFLPSLQQLLENPQPHSVVVIALPYVEKTSALIKAVEKSGWATTVRCYQSNTKFLKNDIIRFFKSKGQQISQEAVDFLLENLGNDFGITQAELEKLHLFTMAKPSVTLVDCLQTITSAPAVNLYKLCDAIGHRDLPALDLYLNEILEENGEIGLLLTVTYKHLKRLQEVQIIAKKENITIAAAVDQLRPAVQSFAKEDFIKQAQTLPSGRLQSLVNRFYAVQLQVRQQPAIDKTVVHRLILSTAA